MKFKQVLCVLGLFGVMLFNTQEDFDGQENIVYNENVNIELETEEVETVTNEENLVCAGVVSSIWKNVDDVEVLSAGITNVLYKEMGTAVSISKYETDTVSSSGNQKKKKKKKKEKTEEVLAAVEYKAGYISTYVNVRQEPNTDCAVIDNLSLNNEVSYYDVNGDWASVLYADGKTGFVSKKYISNELIQEPMFREVWTPNTRDFKSYMSYRNISSWYQKDLQNVAYTGDFGIRMVDGRYCVAVGTATGCRVGDYINLVLENGVEIPCIVGDIKADCDTQSDNLVTAANGCVSEFIIDPSATPGSVLNSGSISNCKQEWQSKVVRIKVYEKNYFN